MIDGEADRLELYSFAALWSGCEPPVPEDAGSIHVEFLEPTRGFPYTLSFEWTDRKSRTDVDEPRTGNRQQNPLSFLIGRWMQSLTEPTRVRVSADSRTPYVVELGAPYSMSDSETQRVGWAARVDPNDIGVRRCLGNQKRHEETQQNASLHTLLRMSASLPSPVRRQDPSDDSTVRPPWLVLDAIEDGRSAGTREEIALILASAAEALGEHPLLVLTKTGMSVGCVLRSRPSFRPLWTAEEVRHCVGEGRFVRIEQAAGTPSTELEMDGVIGAIDIRAARPDIGKVEPLRLSHDPVVHQAMVWATQLGRPKQRLETADLMYGLLRSDGSLLSDTLLSSGVPDSWIELKRSEPAVAQTPLDNFDAPPLPMTRSHAVCLEAATSLSREAGLHTVREQDLTWALLQSRSRSTWRFLEEWRISLELVEKKLAERVPRPAHTRWG